MMSVTIPQRAQFLPFHVCTVMTISATNCKASMAVSRNRLSGQKRGEQKHARRGRSGLPGSLRQEAR